jgi:hypothetical protein
MLSGYEKDYGGLKPRWPSLVMTVIAFGLWPRASSDSFEKDQALLNSGERPEP